MRSGDVPYCLVAVLLASGCLSETLIDNYDPLTYANGGALSGGMAIAGNGLVPMVGAWAPTVAPPQFVIATGGGFGMASGGTSSSTLGVGATAGVSIAATGGVTGDPGVSVAVPIHRAVPNRGHTLNRYVAYDFESVGGYGIELGMTAAEHVVALVPLTGLGSIGGAPEAVAIPSAPALLELTSKGDTIRYVVFPSATVPTAFSMAASGTMVLAGRLDRYVSFGGALIEPVPHGYYVVALDEDWKPTLQRGYATQGETVVRAVAQDNRGAAYLGLSEGTASALVGLDAGFEPTFRSSLSPVSDGNVVISGMHVDRDDTIRIAGQYSGRVEFAGETLVARGQWDGWVGAFAAGSGQALAVAGFGGPALDTANAIVGVSNGHLRIAGQLSDQAELFEAHLSLASRGTPFIADLDAEGRLGWVTLLGEAGTVTAVTERGDRSYVVGYLYGPGSNTTQVSQLYVAVVESDGTVTSMFTLNASGASATSVVVDSAGVIWLSGRADLVPYLGATATDSMALMQLTPASASTAP